MVIGTSIDKMVTICRLECQSESVDNSQKEQVDNTGAMCSSVPSDNEGMAAPAASAAKMIKLSDDEKGSKQIVDAGDVTPFIDHLSSYKPDILYNAACMLSEMVSWKDAISAIVNTGAINPLVHLLSSPQPCTIAEAAKALSFIAEDKGFQEQVMSSGCVDVLLAHMLRESQVSMYSLTHTVSNT